MKKILIALLAVIAILAFLAFSSNNSVNNFFSKDEGVIYKEDGFSWTTKISDKGLFSSTYITDFSAGKTSFSLNHVSFFSPFGAKVKSTLTLPGSLVGNESIKLLSSSSLDDIMPAIKTSLMEYAVIRAKNGLKEFFTPVDGFLYGGGLYSWSLDSADVRENGATYKTTISFITPGDSTYIVPITHEATFGGENLSLFNIGKLKTTITLPESEVIGVSSDKQFSFDSTITFAGFDSKIVVTEQDIPKNYDDQMNVFFDEMTYTFNNDFGKSMFNVGFNVPRISLSGPDDINDIVFKANGIKMSSQNIFNKDFGLWLTDSVFNIEKAIGYDDYTKEEIFILDNFFMKGSIKPGYTNETLAYDLKLSFKSLYASDDSVKLEDMNIDITLDGIDAQSIQEITNAIQYLNPYDEYQLMETGAAFIAVVPALLEKKPKILFNDISVKYNDEVHNMKGVIEYAGNGRAMNLLNTDWMNQVYAKFDIKIGEKLFTSELKKSAAEKFSWPSYYYDDYATEAEIEEHMLELLKKIDIVPANGFVTFVAEFKNGEMLINGKPIPENLY